MSDERITRGGGSECDGNAAPYVLGALPEAESEAFVAHMAGCAVCREEVAALRTVAATLPAAAPQFAAPPELKRRLFAEIDSEASVPSRAGRVRAGRGRALSALLRRRAPRGPGLPWLVPAGAGAALAAAVAVVLVIALGGSGGSRSRVVRAAVSAPGASATLRIDGPRAELRMTHMPQVQRGRVYEVWLKRGAALVATDALFGVSRDGSATVGVPGGVRGVGAVLVTSEPAGGSAAPTRTPIVVARVS